MFDHDAMRKRFHDLGRQRDTIISELDPIIKRRDDAIAAHESELKPIEAQIKSRRGPLYAIDQERALIARALGGKTGAA